jgi:hypothetical protein
MECGLVHFLKDFAVVNGIAILGLAVVKEIGLKSGSEAGVEPVDECLTYADWKGLLVHERAGGSKDLGVIIVDRRQDGVALRVLIRLPDVVKGGVRLL